MLQLLWNMFKQTGQVNVYMLYKALEQVEMEDSSDLGVPGRVDGNTAVGQYIPLEDQA